MRMSFLNIFLEIFYNNFKIWPKFFQNISESSQNFVKFIFYEYKNYLLLHFY